MFRNIRCALSRLANRSSTRNHLAGNYEPRWHFNHCDIKETWKLPLNNDNNYNKTNNMLITLILIFLFYPHRFLHPPSHQIEEQPAYTCVVIHLYQSSSSSRPSVYLSFNFFQLLFNQSVHSFIYIHPFMLRSLLLIHVFIFCIFIYCFFPYPFYTYLFFHLFGCFFIYFTIQAFIYLSIHHFFLLSIHPPIIHPPIHSRQIVVLV